jgi:EVE domain
VAFFINLFTLETWREARENAKFAVSGHRVGVRNRARVRPGDTLLCYVTRTSAFVGAMEVMSKVYEIEHEDEPIWTSDPYPVRFDVKLLLRVPVDNGVRLDEVRSISEDPPLWGWVFRGSLNEIPKTDAEWIMERLRETEPHLGPLDPEPFEATAIDLPPEDDELVVAAEKTKHGPIQGMLATLGRDLGLDVWVAANDRSVVYDGVKLGDLSIGALPSGLPDDIRKRIGLIDVIWLDDNNYRAAFEVEATTGILSGLARMGDLVALVPNFDLPLFIVAPEARRNRVFDEIKRPIFSRALKKPLHHRCRYISFDTLEAELAQLGSKVKMVDPERFLNEIAEEAP